MGGSKTSKSLTGWMRSHPIVLQLQFLPLLYAGPDDRILVSDLPPDPDPRLCLIDDPPLHLNLEDWGPSPAIATWAQQHKIPYSIPPFEQIRQINSKFFSYSQSPQLPGSAWLENEQEISLWIEKTPGPKVLKMPFGTAGNGHIHIPNQSANQRYKGPLIGEPWVERVFDFSSQWFDGQLIGITRFENESNGTYKGTFAGEVEASILQEHLYFAKPLIETITAMGYKRHIGIDAFVYQWEGKSRLHPIVEINGRKTMSWVALQMKQKQLYYTASSTGLLPSRLKRTIFRRNIV